MPVGQLQAAINQHVVDGCLDPWHLTPALHLNDALKMHTEFSDTSPSSTTFVLAMNSAAYDRLPRDLKAVIDGNSGQAAAAMAGVMWDIEAASVADSVVRNGDSIVTLLPEAVAHWRKLTEPVVEKWLKDMKEQKADGGKLLAAAHALILKYINEPEPQPPQPPAAQPAQQDAVAQPPQTVAPPQQAPQAGLASPSNIVPKLNVPAPATTASTPPSTTPVIKPVPPQPPTPPAPHAATPSPAAPSISPPTTIAKPVAPAAPAPPSTATIAPPPKPAAAPALVPTPKPPPAAATAPPAPAAPPAVAPKSLDIPL
jgi:hypothetical protein